MRPGLGSVGNAQPVEHGGHAFEHLCGHPSLGQLMGQGQVFFERQALHKVGALKNDAQLLATPHVQVSVGGGAQIASGHFDRAGLGTEHAAQHVQQGGLARARLAEQQHALALRTGKIGEVHPRTLGAILELHTLHLDHAPKVRRPNVRLDVASHTNLARL